MTTLDEAAAAFENASRVHTSMSLGPMDQARAIGEAAAMLADALRTASETTTYAVDVKAQERELRRWAVEMVMTKDPNGNARTTESSKALADFVALGVDSAAESNPQRADLTAELATALDLDPKYATVWSALIGLVEQRTAMAQTRHITPDEIRRQLARQDAVAVPRQQWYALHDEHRERETELTELRKTAELMRQDLIDTRRLLNEAHAAVDSRQGETIGEAHRRALRERTNPESGR